MAVGKGPMKHAGKFGRCIIYNNGGSYQVFNIGVA